MSNSDKERSTVSSGECGSGGDDDEDDGKQKQNQNQNQNQRGGHRYRRKVKQAVMFPFRKPKKQQQPPPPTYHNSAYCSGSSATKKASRSRGKGRHIGCCYLCCMKQPPTLESPPPFDSHRSDPNNPDVFSYESFKSLIENNVFYSKECNPHID